MNSGFLKSAEPILTTMTPELLQRNLASVLTLIAPSIPGSGVHRSAFGALHASSGYCNRCPLRLFPHLDVANDGTNTSLREL